MLWDIIRDWFVINIWGGVTSTQHVYGGIVGNAKFSDVSGDYEFLDSNGVWVAVMKNIGNGNGTFFDGYISLADWLSTTSTIIVLCALCFFFFLMVRWLFRLTAGLIQCRG